MSGAPHPAGDARPAGLLSRPDRQCVRALLASPILLNRLGLGRLVGRIVFGDIGRSWSLRDVSGPPFASTEESIAFADPGFAKVVANIAVRPAPRPGRTILQIETRVHVPDSGLRRQFAAYWLVIEGGSGLMRRRWLAAIARRAERGSETEGRRGAG